MKSDESWIKIGVFIHQMEPSSAFLMPSSLSFDRIIRLRFQSMCKEYHRHKLVKNAFHHWQIRLMNRRADRRYSSVLQRFVTDLIV